MHLARHLGIALTALLDVTASTRWYMSACLKPIKAKLIEGTLYHTMLKLSLLNETIKT